MLTVAAVGDPHAVGQESEVRLVHAEHVLHRGAGHADLLADDPLAGALAPRQDAERDRVGVIDRELGMTLAQRPHRAPLQQRLVQLRGQLLVQRAPRARAQLLRNSRTLRLKSSARSIIAQCPQREYMMKRLSGTARRIFS